MFVFPSTSTGAGGVTPDLRFGWFCGVHLYVLDAPGTSFASQLTAFRMRHYGPMLASRNVAMHGGAMSEDASPFDGGYPD